MRDRVFGIETEYALIYHPGRGETRHPTRFALYRRFDGALRRRVRSLPNAFSPFREKVGRFLENGGTFHYESTVEDFEYGLIEMASPECRDPFTLIRYERAKDELIEELAGEVNAELRLAGYRGEVRIGKNNVDSQGNSFGSHENYWVEDPLAPLARLSFAAVALAMWLVSLPVLAFVLAIRLGVVVAFLGAALLFALVALVVGVFRDSLARRMELLMRRIAGRLEEQPGEIARRVQYLVAPIYLVFRLHSAVYNRFHFRRIRRALTAFLVTRTVYTGAGGVVFDGGPLFRTAQRAPFIRALARIYTGVEERPIYETRDLFFRPWSGLRSRRRLHLMLADANLCEWAQVLRVGVTALVLEAIESGAEPPWPELADPLAALRQVSEDTSLTAELALADGTRASALALQRRYLAAVQELLAKSEPLPLWKARVLRAWQDTLDQLERDPSALRDRVDWIAKRELLLEVVPDARDREALRERAAEVLAEDGARTAADRGLRALAYRLWRADPRSHELGPHGGYRRLEALGRVRRLSRPEAVSAARHDPPPDTRARARGAAIRAAHLQARSGGAAWHRVRIGKLDWRWFSDPLDSGQSRLPARRG